MKRPVFRACSLLALWVLAAPSWAALNLGSVPLYLGASVKPLVMLTLSKDQELYKKSYSDYSDLDGDGLFETTYKHSINYYGYFDSFKCYSYSSANRRFEPQADTSTLAAGLQKYCHTVAGEWSGNFLNWATMTRMDAVRKVLYGGMRSLSRTADGGFAVADGDTQTSTTLERAYLPTDAHSFAKYYGGTDIAQLTDATPLAVVTTSASNVLIGTGAKNFTVASNANIAVGDIMEFARTASPTTHFMRGNVTAVAGTLISVNVVFVGTGAGTFSGWTATNQTKQGITICNTTLGGNSPNHISQTNINMPRMRVAKGNYVLWAANERWQCIWNGETITGVNGGSAINAVNSNSYTLSRIPASSGSPSLATQGAGTGFGDFFVRVRACVAGLIGTEKCKQYAQPAPTGTLKPIGLVQVYGEPGLINFGLITGSYERNVSGGVLRKNAGPLTDEIGLDGVFLAPPATGSIIGTLNRMRMYGYAYADGTYANAAGADGNCTFALFSITQSPVQCATWGNPMSEIYYETLRYFAGGQPKVAGNPQPTAAYNFTYAGSRDQTLGLPVATWADPVTQANYCAPLNTVVFNSSVSSYDNDQIPGGATKTYLGTQALASTINSPSDAETLTNSVGSSESITGAYFLGRIRGGTAAETNELCDAKTLGGANGLGKVSGLCPEGPTVGGSFLISGLAHHAHTSRIRTDLTVAVANAAQSLKVNTYAVQLSSATPRLEIQVPGGPATQKVVLQPACRMTSGGQGGCALVDVRIVSQERGVDFDRGIIYVNWEDSEQGGDYDQDMWGTIGYCLQSGTTTQCPSAPANSITVTTDVAAQSTPFLMGLGYIIGGTNKDGPHFHSGINNFNYTEPTAAAALTSLTRAGATATGNRNNHGLQVGDRITIAGATGVSATFNGVFTVVTVPNANSFTYNLGAATPTSPAVGAPTVNVGGCAPCVSADTATKFTYAIGTSSAQALKDPLWYAAKYGGFKDTNNNGLPDQAIEWDSKLESGADGTDGIPDNYFPVTNPGALESAMDRTFIYILQVSSASSVATNSTSLQTGSRVYQARFNSNDWSGQLLSFTIDVTGTIDPTPNFDAGLVLPIPNTRVIVTYKPGATPGTAHPAKGSPFRWNDLDLTQLTELSKDGGSGALDGGVVSVPGDSMVGLCTGDNVPASCTMRGKLRLNWLRGDATLEGVTPTRFRVRPTTKLADIVNSTPRFVGPPSATYSDASYITFRSNLASRTPMLYVGSNGGMLHAFEATTGTSGGIERMAYVPNKMYPNLTKLTDKAYSHRYYVDGTPSVTDACFGSCAAAADWRTVLVGGYNSGAQGYYALNVSDPTTWSEGNASQIVLWEFTDVNDPDLGFSYSKPIIAKMANGRWAAIFGNGYNNSAPEATDVPCASGTGTVADPYLPAGCSVSLTGHAYLYILFLDGATDGSWTLGTDYIKISTNTGTDTATPAAFTPAAPNGLTTPAIHTGSDGLVRFAYAGDLVGNMWKFDLQAAAPGSWGVAQAGTPLFTASDASGNRQPITSEVSLFPHLSGIMVMFGTGKYLEVADDSGPYRVDSLYGIWDRFDPADLTVARADLMQQKILNVSATNKTGTFIAFGKELRLVSAFVPNYTALDRTNAPGTFGDPDIFPIPGPNAVAPSTTTLANQRGWFYDFPNSGDNSAPNFVTPGTGERVAFAPQMSTGKLVVTTLIPSTVPCDSGGTSAIFDIDPITGGRLADSAFDLNNDSNFSNGDYVTYGGVSIPVSGVYSTIGIVPQPTIIQAQPGKEIKVLSGSSGGLMTIMEKGGGGPPPGGGRVGKRISWRELLSN